MLYHRTKFGHKRFYHYKYHSENIGQSFNAMTLHCDHDLEDKNVHPIFSHDALAPDDATNIPSLVGKRINALEENSSVMY